MINYSCSKPEYSLILTRRILVKRQELTMLQSDNIVVMIIEDLFLSHKVIANLCLPSILYLFYFSTTEGYREKKIRIQTHTHVVEQTHSKLNNYKEPNYVNKH